MKIKDLYNKYKLEFSCDSTQDSPILLEATDLDNHDVIKVRGKTEDDCLNYLASDRVHSGIELCRLAILKANDEVSSYWVNTIVGYYYKFQPHYKEKPFYAGIAITERLLADFVNRGAMPGTDIDLLTGFTKEARRKMQEEADKFFEGFNSV